jgi:predicted secreted Zn-dependent protease
MERRLTRKIAKRWKRREDEHSPVLPARESSLQARSDLTALQQQVGNRAIQGLMIQSQRQEEDEKKAPNQPASLGKVTVEKPRVEIYDVHGNSMDEVMAQVKARKDWLRYEFEYNPKMDKGVITEVNVTVRITIQQPRWVGANLERMSPATRTQWQQVMESFQLPEEKIENDTELPQQWLIGAAWKDAPDALKSTWRGMLQTMQNRELSPLDIASRRALVLQKQLLNLPENQAKAIFDKFLKDLKKEDDQYARQFEPGKKQKISLSPTEMIQ